jgi:hypothetical protein
VEAWLSSRRRKKLISLGITNKLWSFFATLGHMYVFAFEKKIF